MTSTRTLTRMEMAHFLRSSLSPSMKISLTNFLNQYSCSAHQSIFRLFYCSNSTASQHVSNAFNNLYKRISPLGDPDISIVPVPDQWVSEGRPVTKKQLQKIIGELRVYRRFKHALEVSYWMSDKLYMPFAARDVAIRMNLIFKLYGLEAVENYFNCVPEHLKGFVAHVSLLNCYAYDKSVEKAEATMQILRNIGILSPLSYNIMMNLFYCLGKWKKLDDLMHEMKEKGITYDCYTYSIRLSAYAAASDTAGIDKIVNTMESDPNVVIDCSTFSVIAQAYLNVGHLDKVWTALGKMEAVATSKNTRNLSFDFLLKMYAEIGRKDDVFRIWNMYKKERKIYGKGYISMMTSLSNFNDVEGMEKIYEEWESSGLPYSFMVPNTLLSFYCRNGQVEKAEALINKGSLKGGKPLSATWYYMAEGYIMNDQISKAVEALKKAVLACRPNDQPSKETLITILEYLENGEDAVKEEECLRLLKTENIFPLARNSSHFALISR